MKSKFNEIAEVIANECGDIGQDYLELGIDCLLDSDVLKEVPIVKTVYALIRTPITLWNAYNMQKLIYFCYYMKSIPSMERIKFVNKAIYEDKNFGENLLLTLEKMDDIDKTWMLKKIFQAYGHREGISYSEFRRLCIILTNTFVEDLNYIKVVYGNEYFGGISAIALVANGLARESIYNEVSKDDTEERYSLTTTGKLFYDCVFTDKFNVTF